MTHLAQQSGTPNLSLSPLVRQLDVGKSVLAAVEQLLLQLPNGLPRFQRSGTGHGTPHGLRAGLGGLWGRGVALGHIHVSW